MAEGQARSAGRKGKLLKLAEYSLIMFFLALCRVLPAGIIYAAITPLGSLAFALARRRRQIAIENVRHSLNGLPEGEVVAIARRSFGSFGLAVMPEVAKLHSHLTAPDAREWILRRSPELEAAFLKARAIHDTSGGCIFVTPHFGTWELLPYLGAAFGIPLAVATRPLENELLEELLARYRAGTRQSFLGRLNSLAALRLALARGRSLGLLPDQSTRNGLNVEFLGRPARTTPVPALLAVALARPIVVVACYRTGKLRFGGHVGEPIWPLQAGDERAEVLRLTAAMNLTMEGVIRQHPEQYFWMHNRWKVYEADPALPG